ncbi:MAG: hypothetical protein JW820_11515 [Spirochaetales bacterium]|nr:hypothetical protein [Spirochaetales bacterium]
MRKVELHVGGKRIPLNLFAKEIITKVNVAVIGSLKGVAPEREIILRIGADEDASGQDSTPASSG